MKSAIGRSLVSQRACCAFTFGLGVKFCLPFSGGGQLYMWGKIKVTGDDWMYPKPLMDLRLCSLSIFFLSLLGFYTFSIYFRNLLMVLIFQS